MLKPFSEATRAYRASKTFTDRTERFVQCQRAFHQLVLTRLRSGELARPVESSKVPTRLQAIESAPTVTSESTHGSLTSQQMVVARLIANGLPNRQIADRLRIEPGTVANHVRNILDRLSVDNRVQIAVCNGPLRGSLVQGRTSATRAFDL